MSRLRKIGLRGLLASTLTAGLLVASPAHAATHHIAAAKSRYTHSRARRAANRHHVSHRFAALHHHAFHHHALHSHAGRLTADDLNARELARKAAPPDLADNTAGPAPHTTSPGAHKVIETGLASWYGRRFNGRTSSDGSRYNMGALTAAHRWLPLGSRVRVTLAGTDRSVDVTITDRPGTRSRCIDLSKAAARELGIIHDGVARVTISRL